MSLLALAAAFLLAVLAAALAGVLAVRAGIADAPTAAHKAHAAPVATAGGLAMATGLGVAIAVAASGALGPFLVQPSALRALFGLIALAAAFLVLGLMDDLWTLGPRLKSAVLAAGCVGFAALFARVDALPLTADLVWPLGVAGATAGTAIWMFTLTNGVNFLDGSDGLAFGICGTGLLALAVLGLQHGAPAAALAATAGAGACVGFLAHNGWRARLFAGDAGALFMGAWAAGAGVLAITEGGVAPYAVALCFLPLLADVLLTLMWRWRRGRPLLHSHREHLYQIARRAGVGAPAVAIGYAAWTAHCGVSAIAGALFGPAGALVALVANAAVAAYVAAKVRRYACAHGLDTPL